MPDEPGPPPIWMARGALVGSLRDSEGEMRLGADVEGKGCRVDTPKYQKKRLALYNAGTLARRTLGRLT